nr:tRNA lysidine(34) synthetase TilS [Pseudohalocynthiibacter aestuariivivens]
MPVTQDGLSLQDRIAGHFLPHVPDTLGVAVSGGSDSLALLHLLASWRGASLRVVTVDHGLRPEAATEAQQVAEVCETLGVRHDTLHWDGWDGQGNLPDRARQARYCLMTEWARNNGIDDIALGHTADDQAETLLMRLARRAGIDGLAAMASRRVMDRVTFHRPMLRMTRAALRADLTQRGVSWIDDPSNADGAYRRVRARRALEVLVPLGLTAEGLTQSAHHLAEARATLAYYAAIEARNAVDFHSGDVLLDRARMAALRPDIARRILSAALGWVAGPGYGARGREIDTALQAISAGQQTTLYGCVIMAGSNQVRIIRELEAVKSLQATPGALWDGRWRLTGPDLPGAEIRALGSEGRIACPDWRETGLPRGSIEAGPGVWQRDTLIAAPLAGAANGWTAELCRTPDDFHSGLLSH